MKNIKIIALLGALLIAGSFLSAHFAKNAPAPAPESENVSLAYGSTKISREELEKIDFSLARTPQQAKDSALKFVEGELDTLSKQPYTLAFEKIGAEIDETATANLRRSFFTTDYAERYKITDKYVSENVIAVVAQYRVDYDNDAVPYEDGLTRRAYYLMKTDSTGEWTVWKSETLSVE